MKDIAIDQKDYAQAEKLLQQALAACRRAGDVLAELRLLASLGNLHNASGNHSLSFAFYRQQAEMAEKVGSAPHLCHAQINQVSLLRKENRPEEALALAQTAYALARQIESAADEAFLDWQVGLIYEGLGEIQQAIAHMQRAVQYELENNHPDAQKDLAHWKRLKEQT